MNHIKILHGKQNLMGGKVLALTAIGGMGKSALTWAWALRDVLGLPLAGARDDPADVAADCRLAEEARPDGLLWWSFYERDAKFGAFMNAALAYASGGAVDPDAVPSQHDKLQALLGLLAERRLLIVLDGLERELGAYAGMDAAYRGDETMDDAAHRACVDPAAADFLRRAAALPLASRVLLTSRLFPSDLEGPGGGIVAGCRHETVVELGREDAVTFFADEGVTGTRAEIEQACLPYGRYPLVLRLLAGLIVHDPEKPGDVAVAAGHDLVPDLTARQHHVLEWSYDALDDDTRALLSRIAAFRSPMDYAALAAISPLDDEAALKAALTALRRRGLLLFDASAARHDLYPIVRRYAYERLADKDGVHARLRDYFDALPPPKMVTRLEDLAPVIELYHHTVRAGDYDTAADLYYDRLSNDLFFRLGAYQTCIDLLATLFPDGEDRPPRLEDAADQAWTINELANAYTLSGRSRRAVPLFKLHNEVQENRGDKLALAIGLGNLAKNQQSFGELAATEQGFRQRITLCQEIKDAAKEAIGHRDLGLLLARRGAFGESGTALDRAAEIFNDEGIKQGLCVAEAYCAERSLLIGENDTALAAARRARRLADEVAEERYPHERDFVRAEWLQGAALFALAEDEPDGQNGRLAEAEGHLRDALTRCRRISLVGFESAILLAWARWHRLKGSPDDARRDAMDALAIADRCEYRLDQADIRNFLARLALDAGDTAGAREQAEMAMERAECDGPPHRYEPAHQEAERLLAEAGD